MRPNRQPGPILEAACWAHARRKFFELAAVAKAPIAAEAVRRIDQLFAIERDINGRSADERRRARQEQSAPLVAELEPWLRAQQDRVSRKSETGKAIAYTLKRWTAFTRFLDDGRICMSNNAAERALRGIAVGRGNWTFAGSDRGGERAAAIYTLIETAKLNDIDPQAWLADVLARISDHPAKRLDELLPWNWKTGRQGSSCGLTIRVKLPPRPSPAFNYPHLGSGIASFAPRAMSVSRERPRQMTVFPGGGSRVRAR